MQKTKYMTIGSDSEDLRLEEVKGKIVTVNITICELKYLKLEIRKNKQGKISDNKIK